MAATSIAQEVENLLVEHNILRYGSVT